MSAVRRWDHVLPGRRGREGGRRARRLRSTRAIERKICAVLGGRRRIVVCSTLAQLFGISERDVAPEESFWAVRRFLEAVAERGPLVVVFDDIHWGQATFLDLIEHVTDWSRGAPILVLCMARPDLLDLRPAWGGGKFNAATISLEPFPTRLRWT